MKEFQFRTITAVCEEIKTTYLHEVDVAAFLMELAATEPADTRNRLEHAARLIMVMSKNQPQK